MFKRKEAEHRLEAALHGIPMETTETSRAWRDKELPSAEAIRNWVEPGRRKKQPKAQPKEPQSKEPQRMESKKSERVDDGWDWDKLNKQLRVGMAKGYRIKIVRRKHRHDEQK